MKEPKPYEPPRLIRIWLNHTQAVLSQCSVGVTGLWQSSDIECRTDKNCRNDGSGHGDSQSTP